MNPSVTLRGGPLDGGAVAGVGRAHELLLFAADRPSHLWLIDPEPDDPPRGASFYAYGQCPLGHFHYEQTLSAYAVLDLMATRALDLEAGRDQWSRN
jgi:hypothetical protein